MDLHLVSVYAFVASVGTSLSVFLLASFEFPHYTNFSPVLILPAGRLRRNCDAAMTAGEFPSIVSFESPLLTHTD